MAGEKYQRVMISAQSVKERSAEHFHIKRARKREGNKGCKNAKRGRDREQTCKRGQMLVLLGPPTQRTAIAENKAERPAKITFPFYLWSGGQSHFSRRSVFARPLTLQPDCRTSGAVVCQVEHRMEGRVGEQGWVPGTAALLQTHPQRVPS